MTYVRHECRRENIRKLEGILVRFSSEVRNDTTRKLENIENDWKAFYRKR